MLLSITDCTVARGGRTVLTHFSFSIRGTEKAAIVGRNGAGKTTLLEVLAGEITPEMTDDGTSSNLSWARKCTVGLLTQQPSLKKDQPAGDMIAEAARKRHPSDDAYEKDLFAEEARGRKILTAMGFHLSDLDRSCGTFSGGEQVRLSLVRLMMAEPEVLLLDEPTNHLDLAAVEFLERYLATYPHAVIAVSHDRFFLDRFANVVWEVRNGRLFRYPGNYTAFREERTAEFKKQSEAWRRQQAEIVREKSLIETFRHKPKKAAFARARRTMLERMPKIERPDPIDAVIHTGDIVPERPGNRWPVNLDHLKIGYDHVIRELTIRIRRGSKIGIIGPNGSGKSTLLRTIAGLLMPLGGRVTIGGHIDLAYFDQMTAAFTDARTVREWFHDRYPSLTEKELREKLASYLFRGRDLAKKVSALSGGEKARLALAGIIESCPNLLLLDEPTNNMDIPARETMESLFKSYRGTVLVVSHDRYFLQQVTDSLLILKPGTTDALYYPFGYAHYRKMLDENASGGGTGALRTLENQRLIDELRAVPKAERHEIHLRSTAEETLDWKFELNHRERTKAEETVVRLDEAFRDADAEYRAAPVPDSAARSSRDELAERLKTANARWTETLLDWYDLWLEQETGLPHE